MNSKCKFCGYRFQSDDEMVCPECLTAREEDITCGVYGDENHSHDLDPFSKGFDIDGTDMYKEKKNDFVAKERKEEAADPNFKSPVYRKSSTQNYRQTYQTSGTAQNRRPYNFTASQTNNQYVRLNNNSQQSFQNSGFNSQQQRPKQTSNGCVVAVIIFVVAMLLGFVSMMDEEENAKDYFPNVNIASSAYEADQ